MLLLVVMSISCRTQKTQSTAEPVVTMEDHASKMYEYPDGVYYVYEFDDETPYDFDETVIIKALLEAGIQPLDIWYKGGSSMCVPPGSDIGMTVIVPPGMLVRLEKVSDQMPTLGFTIPEEPHVGDCAYRVRRYQYTNN